MIWTAVAIAISMVGSLLAFIGVFGIAMGSESGLSHPRAVCAIWVGVGLAFSAPFLLAWGWRRRRWGLIGAIGLVAELAAPLLYGWVAEAAGLHGTVVGLLAPMFAFAATLAVVALAPSHGNGTWKAQPGWRDSAKEGSR